MKRLHARAYVDANIFSVMFYPGNDLKVRYQRLVTWEWWKHERKHFEVFSSTFAESELSRGVFRGQEKSLALIRRLAYIPVSSAAKRCIAAYIQERLVPETKHGDAAHLALATVHRVDYLLTWNHAHLANPWIQERLKKINRHLGFPTPFVVSPDTIPKAALGQRLWRRDHEKT